MENSASFKESVLVEEFFGKRFKIRFIEDENGRAALTHYLMLHDHEEAGLFKNEGVNFYKNYLENRDGENCTLNDAYEAIQYRLFDYKNNIPFKEVGNPNFKFIDLFAGIGGFRLALQNLGGRCVFSSEWDEGAKQTYYANFGEIPFGDITKEETKQFIPDGFDVLCAGFPCQAFSIAGYRKGFSDTRGTLFFDIEEIIYRHRPKVVFLENVKNLISHDKGKTFKIIVEILEEKLGYKVFHKVLNSMTHANVPQNRERIFIVAFDPIRVKNYSKFTFPKEVKLTTSIKEILEKGKQEEKFYYREDHPYFPELNKSMVRKNTVYQWRRVYVRENKSNVCPTLTANMGAGGHNVPLIKDDFGIRKLTPKECFAFQGYPIEKYILPSIANSKLYMQAGNSVTTTLIERIGQEILKVI